MTRFPLLHELEIRARGIDQRAVLHLVLPDDDEKAAFGRPRLG